MPEHNEEPAVPAEVERVIDLTEPTSLEGIVARQTEQIGQLVSVVGNVSKLLQRSEHNRTRDRLVYVTLIGVLVVLMLGVGGMVLKLNHVSTSNKQVLDLVKDCTDPNGTCSKQGQQRFNQAVKQLLDGESKQHDQLLQRVQQLENDAVTRFCLSNPTQCQAGGG